MGAAAGLATLGVPVELVDDETGGIAGLVTPEENKAAPRSAEAPVPWAIEGRVNVRNAIRELGLELPGDPAFSIIAGLALHRLGHDPVAGASLAEEESGLTVEVLDNTPRSVVSVRLSRSGPR